MSEIVFRAGSTSKPVFHTDKDCPNLKHRAKSIKAVSKDTLDSSYRECEYCRYRDIPALD